MRQFQKHAMLLAISIIRFWAFHRLIKHTLIGRALYHSRAAIRPADFSVNAHDTICRQLDDNIAWGYDSYTFLHTHLVSSSSHHLK